MKRFFAVLFCALSVISLCGCGKMMLEIEAVDVVDAIVEEQLGPIVGKDNLTKCDKVELDKEVSDGVWIGRAYFENGKVIDCRVTDKNDQIYVEIDFSSLR